MTITVKQWQEAYIDPLVAVMNGELADDDLESGFAGFVLDGILKTKEIDGELATDWECVEMIAGLIELARQASEILERAEG